MGAPTCTGYSGAEIYERIHAKPGAEQDMPDAAREVQAARDAYNNVAGTLGKLQTRLGEIWQGSGADAAHGGMTRALTAVNAALTNFEQTKASLDNQSFAFNGVKTNVVKMDKGRPDDQGITDYLSIGASDAEKAAAQWDTDNKHNIEWYDRYNSSTTPNQSQLPPAYQHVTDAADAPAAPPSTQQVAPVVPGGTGGPGRTGGATGGARRAGTTANSRGGSGQAYVPPARFAPPPLPAPLPPGAPVGSVDQATATSGYVPPGQTPAGHGWSGPAGGYDRPGGPSSGFGPGGSSSGFGPGGFGPGGSGATAGGSGSPAGRFGAGGSGGRGAGWGPGRGMPGAEPGEGRRMGAGSLSESAAMRANPASATRSSAGAGPGGMAGGNRGQGADDDEYQRKLAVPGDDPDDIFGGDLPRAYPPVIGE